MKYLIALFLCFNLAAQTTVNNFTVKTNLSVANQPVSISVNTVSDLIGLNADTDRTVDVLGRVSVGDGGGGLFRRVLASSGTANTGTFFVSTQNPTYAWSRVADANPVSALWFGATANDAVDDTTALQNWLNYCDLSKKSGKLPSGNYRISSGLTIGTVGNFDSASIIGDGETSIITQYGTNVPCVTLTGSWSIKDLRLQSSSLQPNTATNSVGVLLYRSHLGVIDGLVVHGFAYGIRKKIENGNYVFSQVIQNCRIEAFSKWGITFTREGASGGDSGSVFINNYINTLDPEYSGTKGTAEGGMAFESNSETTLIQQNVEWAKLTDSCYKFTDCVSATIIAPHVEGVDFVGTNYVSIFNNFQSRITINSGNALTISVSNTVPEIDVFYGYGTGSTFVSGFTQTGLSNPGSITFKRFNLPNAGHVGTFRDGSCGTSIDNVYIPVGYAANYVFDYETQKTAFNWTTNNFVASTNLTVGTDAIIGRNISVGNTSSYAEITVDKQQQANSIFIGSYRDTNKVFYIKNDNGYLYIDGQGSNSNEVLFRTKNTTRAQIKTGGQFRFIPLSSNPANPEDGDVYYNSVDKKLKCFNGITWMDLY